MVRLTRRSLLAQGTALAALPRPAFSMLGQTNAHIIDMGNAAYFDRDRARAVLDATDGCTRANHDFYETLARSGVDTVIRYYSDQNNANLNCKNVTRRERDMLHDHGLSLAIVYQFEGRKKNRFTGDRGSRDAQFCLDRARVIGQPEGSTIYFGVDSDAQLNTDQGVLDYFRAVNRVLGGRFDIGIYAAGARCRLIQNAGLASRFWVPEAPAWAGTHAYLNSGDWHLFQNKTNINLNSVTDGHGQPIHIDTNIVNPDQTATIGAFNRDGSIRTYDRQRLTAIADARYWVNGDKASVHRSPGDPEVAHICVARTVHVTGIYGEWAEVDIDEDGLPEGYTRLDGLTPLRQMPKWRRSSCKLMDI
ncbi:MAG: glycoside hydrolase domain-containing protein [Ruegeria sp.]